MNDQPIPQRQPLPGMPEPFPRCQRCGRLLRVEPGRTIGYGPVCAQIAGIDTAELLAVIGAATEALGGRPDRTDGDHHHRDQLADRVRAAGFSCDTIQLADGRMAVRIAGGTYSELTVSMHGVPIVAAYTKWSAWWRHGAGQIAGEKGDTDES